MTDKKEIIKKAKKELKILKSKNIKEDNPTYKILINLINKLSEWKQI